jgi:hypothetical protein
MSRNLDGRVERLERARGVRRNVVDVRELTTDELIEILIEDGVPIRHGMPDAELIAIIEAELAKHRPAEAEPAIDTAGDADHVASAEERRKPGE